MENQFKVPKIPKVSPANLVTSAVRPKAVTAGRKSGTSAETRRVRSSGVAPKVVKVPPKSSSSSSSAPNGPLPKLCPACSKILIEYLAPIESYIKDILQLADASVTNRAVVVKKPSLSVVQSNQSKLATSTKSSQVGQVLRSNIAQSSQPHSNSNSNSYPNQTHQSGYSNPNANYSESMSTSQVSHESQRADVALQYTHAVAQQPSESISGESNHCQQQQWSQNHQSNHSTKSQVGGGGEVTTISATIANSEHGEGNRPTSAYQSNSSEATYTAHQNQQLGTINSEGHSGTDWTDRSSKSEANASDHRHHHHQEWKGTIETRDVTHNRTEMGTGESANEATHASHQTDLPSQSHPTHSTSSPIEQYGEIGVPSEPETIESSQSPFAYVTIVSSNFSAINAMLLANSIYFYNNHYLNVLDEHGHGIKQRYHIPLVVLVCHSIDDELLELLHQIFDQVIELKPHDAILLNDDSLGIQQLKVHLWKELAHFSKCIFLESSTVVVGQISNLLLEYDELSACVDCFFPDNFNCSVFVFEPSVDTFRKLINYGLHQRSANGSPIELDSVDEMTLLNEFFASKWNKLSFIYNFVRNDMSYTQISAYFKFGSNVRVVNFGHNVGAASFSLVSGDRSNQQLNSPQQPWNFKMNVGQVELQEEPFEDAHVDSYSKFYLRLFIRRVWPLISKKLTPTMLSHHRDQTEWTVAELAQMIGRQSGTVNSAFDQTNFTLRRKKSWVTTLDQPIRFDSEIEELEDQVESLELTSEDNTSETLVDTTSDLPESSEVESEPDLSAEEQRELQRQLGQRIKREWEDGRVDWMNQHQSDKIMNRLNTLIRKN